MNYSFWKKAGIATGAIGTIAIGSAVLANDAAPSPEQENLSFNRPGVMLKMHNAHKIINDEEVQKAIENRDYDAFAKALADETQHAPKILEKITAQNFDRYVDLHEAVMNKDFEAAKAIAEELGLPQMGERGMHNRQQFHTLEERQAIHEAALNGDYQTWFELVAKDGELPEFLQVITEDNFPRYQEMHQLMDDAKSIREELGLELKARGPGNGMGRGMGMGMHR